MKAVLITLTVMIAGFASACDRLVVAPTAKDYAAVQQLILGKKPTTLTMPDSELKKLQLSAKKGYKLEPRGTSTIGALTLTDGFWFTKNHSIRKSFIIRIYATDSGKRKARLEFPAG
jgi:hypothetical protein